MVARTRTRLKYFSTAGYCFRTSFGVPQPHSDDTIAGIYKQVYQNCTDVAKQGRSDHTLSIQKWVMDCVPMNGVSNVGGSTTWTFNNYLGNMANNQSLASVPSWPSRTTDATRLLARTNPNAFQVQTLENLVDIGDLPKLVQLAGNTILKRGAGAYLSWEFGWKPLISDLKKMLDWQALTNKKVRELHALYQSGGLHRKRNLQTWSYETATNANLFGPSFGTNLTVRRKTFITAKRWGSVRYLPTTLPPKDESDYRRRALRIVYGLDLTPSSIWESLPWSWLADWFGNVGDYLVKYNNLVPVVASTPCIMEQFTQRTDMTRTDSETGVSGGTSISRYDSKNRYLVAPGITASMPFLTARQLSILGALFITKHRAR